MTIGVLTYFDEMNFGANLQGVSTYNYLLKHGHTPVFIDYRSEESLTRITKTLNDVQYSAHHDFIETYIGNRTEICKNANELLREIKRWKIEAIIVGSDAVLQHHPLITRIKRGKRKPFYIQQTIRERTFPNLFWGCGWADKIPSALMSVSSQNSDYFHFLPWTKTRMKDALALFKYISVRDTWTQKMIEHITGYSYPVTPDPVFAFNFNAPELVQAKEPILQKYHLPDKYALISLYQQSLPLEVLDNLKRLLFEYGVVCVALTMPNGIHFAHHFDYEIKVPLSPLDWYALIKHSSAYIGSNMHPIVVSLHNIVPCVSIDIWGRTDFFNRKINDGSSKVEHIMNEFGVVQNHRTITNGLCHISAEEIVDGILSYPCEKVATNASVQIQKYNNMMKDILTSIEK